MHCFTDVTASGQTTTIHHMLQMSTRIGQPATQWNRQKFATDMDWTDMGIRTVQQPPNKINRAPLPTNMPVLVEVVL